MKYPGLIAIFCAFVLSGAFLYLFAPEVEQDFEEFALGEGTSSCFARHDGYPIHTDNLEQQVVDSMITGWQQRGRKEVIFLFGNSQMHGINQYREGHVSYNHILFDSLQTQYDVLAQSVPNANMQEILYMFQFWNQKVKISSVVVPVFFDDMREDGIRFAFSAERNKSVWLTQASQPALSWNASLLESQNASSEGGDNAALANTVQERVEMKIDSVISQHSATWRNRPTMRGQIFTTMFFLRNRVFGINPQSVRRIIPAFYEKYFAALELLAGRTQEEGIALFLYIPPIRSDVSIPYDSGQYAEFKNRLEDLAARYPHISLNNFETVVEGKDWGMKESTTMGKELEYDFMHFSYEGHKALAESIYEVIRPHLK